VEVFKTGPQLVVIQPFDAPTKLAALLPLNDEPEAFDLRLRLSEVGAFTGAQPANRSTPLLQQIVADI
jgi:hypothetical protein